MTLWWIGDAVLLVVVLPVVVYLLHGVLSASRSIVPSVRGIAATAAAGSKDLDAAALLLTTQSQVEETPRRLACTGTGPPVCFRAGCGVTSTPGLSKAGAEWPRS